MIDWLIDPLGHGIVVRALIEVFILGAVGGAVGCWIILYEISYSAESLAHGMFPGLVGAALLGLPLLLGGAIGILAAALLIAVIGRLSPDTPDTAIAVVVTTLFGLGVLMALSPESPPGIQSLLFGDPLAVRDSELITTGLLGLAVLGILWRGHDRLLAVGFSGATSSAGATAGRIRTLLLLLVAITVLVGVQSLGNLLVAAILVGPAAAARLVTRRMGPMIAGSVLIAVLCGLGGVYLSFHFRIAAGAAIVGCIVTAYLLVAVASTIGPGRRSGSSPRRFITEPEGAGS